MLVVIGGTTYAAAHYLWEPSQVKTGSQSLIDGHQTTELAIHNCQSVAPGIVRSEADKHTSLSLQAVNERVQAECELNTISSYVFSKNTDFSAKSFYSVDPCISRMPSRISVGETLTVPGCDPILIGILR